MDPRPRPILKALTPALLTQLVNAVIAVLTAFEVVRFNEIQLAAIAGLLTVVGLLLTTLGILTAEGDVTPTSDPQLPANTTVTLPDGTSATVTKD